MLYDSASRFVQHHITVERSGRTCLRLIVTCGLHEYIDIYTLPLVRIWHPATRWHFDMTAQCADVI